MYNVKGMGVRDFTDLFNEENASVTKCTKFGKF